MIDFSAVMEVLKNGSDQDIIAGMRAGSIPSQMAVAELQDRAKTRTAAAGQPPQQSVQGALESNEGPQALPDIPNQPQMQAPPKVQGMAAGGLVSFKHGGEVRGYAGGGALGIDPTSIQNMYPIVGEPTKAYQERMRARAEQARVDPMYMFSQSVLSPDSTAGDVTEIGGYTPYDPNKLYGVQPKVNTGFSYRPLQDIFPEIKPSIRTKPVNAAKTTAPQVKPEPPLVLDPTYDKGTDRSGGSGIRARVGVSSGTAGGSSGGNAYNIPEVVMPAAPNYDKYRDLTDEASASKVYDEGVGTNEGLTKREARIADKEAALARDSKRAPWLALMKAGLGMAASKNRSLFGAAGEGGIAGLNDYANAQEGINRRDDALFDRRSAVEDAVRADKLARFGYIQGQVSKAGDVNRTLGIKGLDQGYEGAMKGVDLNARRNETMAKLKQDDIASQRSYSAQMAGVNAQRTAAAKLSDQERFFQRAVQDPAFLKKDATGKVIPDIEKIQTAYYTAKGAAQIYGADQRASSKLLSDKNAQLRDMVKNYQTDTPAYYALVDEIRMLESGGASPSTLSDQPATLQR